MGSPVFNIIRRLHQYYCVSLVKPVINLLKWSLFKPNIFHCLNSLERPPCIQTEATTMSKTHISGIHQYKAPNHGLLSLWPRLTFHTFEVTF